MSWIKLIKNNPREWRRFGLLLGLILIGFGFWLGWQSHPLAMACCFGTGLAAWVVAWIAPPFLRWPYLLWMTVGLLLGTIVSTIFLTVFFLLILSPIALLARLLGKDFLELKLHSTSASYWKLRPPAKPPQPSRYKQQF